MKELEYNQKTWRAMLKLAKMIDRNHENDSFSGYVDGSKNVGSMGDSLDRARRFCRLLAWILGESERFYMVHPKSGEMRSITYSYTDYSDTTAGFYIEQ
jgi:hypothetical protein